MTALLGVERSFTGRRWRARLEDERIARAIAQAHDLPDAVARVLAARGVAVEDVPGFLAPTLRAMLPDPSSFKDMDRAAERLARAIRSGEQVAAFGDYDVDGATSTALLSRFFAAVGGRLRPYIPDRIKEGYGPNLPALERLKDEGAKVVVTLDCGVGAHEALAGAARLGLEVIVCDHHVAEPALPPALAVVNPNRLDETVPYRQLAAVGVAFLLLVAVNRSLRAAGHYATRPEPDLMALLDLVALGTVADVVPLTGLNRALVARGLEVLARRENVGLRALAEVARLQESPGTYHLGYVLGPRVNAGGRVGEADLGARLLATDDAEEAAGLALRLERHNAERRAIEAEVERAAIRAVEAAPPGGLALAAGEGWHPGVIGVVAGRLKERFDRPALVIALAGGIGKGSARSVPGVDIGAAVLAARQAGLLVNGGGHPMAAGLTVESGRVAALGEFLSARLAAALAGRDLTRGLGIDAVIAPGGATTELLEMIERAGPYGAGHAEPRFAVAEARLVRADIVGERHVRCIAAGPDGGRLKAIAFRALDSELGKALLEARERPVHLAGALRADRFRGEQGVQLTIDDAAPVTPRT
ncbi:MAG: single-stranded-DNA-specific exonuclease RecJ [Alphaproteobacteria bacterium]|nr:single-stranded-DNA-specific exonuclease RecJ [Alphaproteobacteria bacterium]